ncbi:hypothetical protein H4W79_003066 [Nocardiopsis terrae]|uniref:DUF222 domain-containing protein n=1 Tax=Nocardiopsis terrae TaxID=372655 RepID=A0ABR9HIM3_9ACTN|nr:hypothetical protein [Nocardiopsis terrae]MBE1458852.1 hypothetical protein [Nocardiopsis terrae]
MPVPRRRPGSIRAAVPRRERHHHGRPFAIPGLSAQACAEIARIEHQRPDLYPGAVCELIGAWAVFVRLPHRRLRTVGRDDPRQARSLVSAVACAMTPYRARELRRRLRELDELY